VNPGIMAPPKPAGKTDMRNTARNRNNRMRLQKIGKKLRQQAKAAKKAARKAAPTPPSSS
jgi:hypothetical protein